MLNSSFSRSIRAAALALLALAAGISGAACGKDGDGGPTGPIASDPGTSDPGTDPGSSDPGTPQGPAPVGDVIYAVDLANNFLVFGTGSLDALTAKMRVSGLPLLRRVIGITIRPSDGALIGVGNDSRVYTIDPLTAEATPISSSPFSPSISYIFDIHFAMALEPNGERVRLIAAESGGNWSINLTDGTATLEENSRYAVGTPLEGRTPRLLGLVYPTLPDSAKQPGWCENLAYAVDADEAILLASCDPATGAWWPTGQSPDSTASVRLASAGSPATVLRDLKDQLMRCGEFMNSQAGSSSEGEPHPPEGGPWFPRAPDTEFYLFLVEVGELQNRATTVKLIDGKDWQLNAHGEVASEDPIQSALFAKGGLYGPSADSPYNLRREVRQEPRLSAVLGPEPVPSDPRAQCSSR